jgi:hypothetical protein
MTMADSHSSAFITLEFNQEDREDIESALKQDYNGASFVYKNGNQSYMLVHNESAEYVLRELNNRGVNYVRPEWDQRYNLYTIHPSDVNSLSDAVEQFNEARTHYNGSAMMQIVEYQDGGFGIQVDTSLQKSFVEICQGLDIRVQEELINMTEYEMFGQPSLDTQQMESEIDVANLFQQAGFDMPGLHIDGQDESLHSFDIEFGNR